uniref:Receptor ligand binding region domain-containing protein n=2 Tax=Xenopus tropicalis TaxID=8364 RepID=A0A1B8Y9N7_XENTR
MLTLIILLLELSGASDILLNPRPECELNDHYYPTRYEDGDFVIAAFIRLRRDCHSEEEEDFMAGGDLGEDFGRKPGGLYDGSVDAMAETFKIRRVSDNHGHYQLVKKGEDSERASCSDTMGTANSTNMEGNAQTKRVKHTSALEMPGDMHTAHMMGTAYETLFQYYRHYVAFLFAVEEINRSSRILPNISLGYIIYDTCENELKSIYDALAVMSGMIYQAPNYDCWEKAKLMGYVGDVTSSTKFSLAQLISMFRYPQASRSTIYYIFSLLSPGEAESLSEFSLINM